MAAFANMKWVEPHWLKVGRHQLALGPKRGTPLKLLHLSDFHASKTVSLDYIQDAIRKGLALEPDLICITGDFISWRFDQFDLYAKTLKPLASAAPTLATLGNHDGGAWAAGAGYSDTTQVRRLLELAGIELLQNRSASVQIKGRHLQLVGVGDLWAGEFDATRAFSATRQSDATVLLSHNPDTKDRLRDFSWDLMLCGHTHGGECDLAFLGTPFAPVADKRYVHGLHRWENRWIHITKGVGSLFGLRFNCRPEVSLLTLV